MTPHYPLPTCERCGEEILDVVDHTRRRFCRDCQRKRAVELQRRRRHLLKEAST